MTACRAADPILAIEDLAFGWPGQPDLIHVPSFTLGAGESVFLHGPSGGGKSTLLSLIGGVLVPDRGTITVAGQSLGDLGPAGRDRLRADRIGIVFQLFNLLSWLSAEENVLLAVTASRARRARLGDRGPPAVARDMLRRLGIDDPGQRADRLSVGQQQRVAAARALIGSPPLLIADEPTSALDEDRRDAFVDLLLTEARDAGTAVLFVSHDRALAPRFDRSASLGELRG